MDPLSTVTPSMRSAAACRAAPPAPLASDLASRDILLPIHQEVTPGRYDTFRVDDSLPWHVLRVKEVIGLGRVDWEVLQAYANLPVTDGKEEPLRIESPTDRGHWAAVVRVMAGHSWCSTHVFQAGGQCARMK
jgi:hypothetical protein